MSKAPAIWKSKCISSRKTKRETGKIKKWVTNV